MADSSPRLSSPPSPPTDVKSVPPPRLRGGAEDPDARPARLQMIAALLLGLALVAVPLYLWRRPRTARPAPDTETTDLLPRAHAGASPSVAAPSPPEPAGAGPAAAPVMLSEPRVLECHDPGPRKTAPDACDRLSPVEQSFAKAITDAAGCVPTSAGGGSLVFVADVSFARKRSPFSVTAPKDGRALGPAGAPGRAARASAKTAAACSAAVKRGLEAASASLPTVAHAHARYKVAITATYPAPPHL